VATGLEVDHFAYYEQTRRHRRYLSHGRGLLCFGLTTYLLVDHRRALILIVLLAGVCVVSVVEGVLSRRLKKLPAPESPLPSAVKPSYLFEIAPPPGDPGKAYLLERYRSWRQRESATSPFGR
jgi:hypothetical protein